MGKTLDDFQLLLSLSGNYQSSDMFKKGEMLEQSMAYSQTSKVHTDNIIYKIVTEIAEAEDVDPLELTPPLSEVIDPDALGQLLATTPTDSGMEVRVSFSYKAYEVTVRANNVVEVICAPN